MMRRWVSVLGIAGLCLGFGPAWADTRIALVIGNGDYRHSVSLPNSRRDATLIAATLRDLQFHLIGDGPALDLDKAQFLAAVRHFGEEARTADVALFYYAGHGIQIQNNNYLVPVDAKPETQADVDFELIDLALLEHQITDESKPTHLALIILDACRNNPFSLHGSRGLSGGLAPVQAVNGTLISYATQPGNVAEDGPPGQNGPFAKALAAAMRIPGQGVYDVFNRTGLAVQQATSGDQIPWFTSSPLQGSFYFAGTGNGSAPPAPLPPQEIAAVLPPPSRDTTPSPARPFDGIWLARFQCEAFGGAEASHHRHYLTITDSHITGQVGVMGTAGSHHFDGSIAADGTSRLDDQFFTGDPRYSVGNLPEGTPMEVIYAGQFSSNAGSFVRKGRPCTVRMTKTNLTSLPEIDPAKFHHGHDDDAN